MERKNGSSNLTKGLLEEVIRSHMLADPNTIVEMRNSEEKPFLNLTAAQPDTAEGVENNFLFLLNFYATFAAEGVPSLQDFQAVFYHLAQYHGLFSPKTKKRVIKDWSRSTAALTRQVCVHGMTLATRAVSSRRKRIQILKELIFKVVKDAHGDDHEAALQQQVAQLSEAHQDSPLSAASSSDAITLEDSQEETCDKEKAKLAGEVHATIETMLANPVDAADTLPHEDMEAVHPDPMESRRQALKVRDPLLPAPLLLDAGLEEQVNTIVASAGDSGDKDMHKALEKKAAARAGTGKADSAAQAEATQSKPKRARGKQPKAEVEGNPSKKTKASEPSAVSKGGAPPVAELANPDALGKEPAQDTKARDMKETDTRGPGEENGERKKRAPRARPTTEQIETAWKLKEPLLREVGIEPPSSFSGNKQSFTLAAPRDDCSSIGCLWFSDQFYVTETKVRLPHYCVNASGGTTVSLKKRGGLAAAWEDSKAMAGWISAPDPAAEAQDVE